MPPELVRSPLCEVVISREFAIAAVSHAHIFGDFELLCDFFTSELTVEADYLERIIAVCRCPRASDHTLDSNGL